MIHEAIQTSEAPAAIGPYSQAVRSGNAIYVSGQLPIDPKTGAFSGNGIESQTERSLENIREILTAAGSDLKAVVKTTVYLKDMADFSAMNAVYARFFSGVYPARVAVEVARLPKDALVEIDAIAVR